MTHGFSTSLRVLFLFLLFVSVLAVASIDVNPVTKLDVPYVATDEQVVLAMLKLAQVTEEDKVFDLGSGDGRIPIAAARRGSQSVGIELDPRLVRESRRRVKDLGLQHLVRIEEMDVRNAAIDSADVVFLYLSPSLNLELKPALQNLKPGSRVVSHIFPIEGWKPDKTVVLHGRRLYMWTVR